MDERIKIAPNEIKAYAESAGVKHTTVRKFLIAGVPEDDIEEVLDMRNKLTEYDSKGRITGQATVEAMIEAWQCVDGEIDCLDILVDRALEKVIKKATTGQFNRALHVAMEEFQNGGLDALDQ
ncbi:hypothetical protein A2630_00250 [Candidatus Woesebacteria bacterium RIFCSPHIGHO2_01_FULL_44_10]|uniref:Uncharacterized protein n=1 Tax=Candidatus Woesebacteria bacterium RIFCSPLOWO2_01_FULL_44_14 TaxID=1802525 RepID=A0A1F8BX97_9BACT|nr:MAG: hypothetical protein A2630_00250 [Candidatus Woesebacteria bacterium RIFCSPHIGHO2_01_FULL_44_10]OGM55804.1 MAG: hypothetical protein A3F62_04235 [Candidatus Woesebacteria bacterium RIFCSPHIGHO2_12_FULL_44_11]OGM68734.1 MAG: hypothetical protein A2975_05550 [Candidatus Woesebacteria bacterium RIFCSPLOWO2_01_FULL_44_14]